MVIQAVKDYFQAGLEGLGVYRADEEARLRRIKRHGERVKELEQMSIEEGVRTISDVLETVSDVQSLTGTQLVPLGFFRQARAAKRLLNKSLKKERKSMARRKTYKKKRSSKRKSFGSIKTNSNSYNNKKLKRKVRKKRKISPSMASKISTLEGQMKKLLPSLSRHTRYFEEPVHVGSNVYCSKRLHLIPVMDKAKYTVAINGLRGANPIDNQKTNIDYVKIGLVLRANRFPTVTLKAKLVLCVDSTNDNPLTLINARLTDRGLNNGSLLAAVTANPGVTSYVPESLTWTNNNIVVPAFDMSVAQYFRKVGKTYSATLNSGDSLSMSWILPKFTYDNEDYSDATETQLKGLTAYVIVDTIGELAHESTTVKNVQKSWQHLDGYFSHMIKCSIVDDVGSNTMSYSSNWDNDLTSLVSKYEKPVSGVVSF